MSLYFILSSPFFFFLCSSFFFFNATATTEIYTLSLHDALPIWRHPLQPRNHPLPYSIRNCHRTPCCEVKHYSDRKSTRLNSSHLGISYAVFCLKKKKIKTIINNKIIDI